MTHIANRISIILGMPEKNVANVLSLLEEGATIPFIARYRKEKTGGLDEVAIRDICIKSKELSEIEKRKEYVLSVIEQEGKLTDELRSEITSCFDANRIEDLYLPFKPKRKTRAYIARENGLEPLAKIIMSQKCSDVTNVARKYLSSNVNSVDDAINGAKDIMAEWISENLSNRNRIRNSIAKRGRIRAKGNAEKTKYADYNDYSSRLATVPSHVFLAIQRAENEKILKLSVETDDEGDIEALSEKIIRRDAMPSCQSFIKEAVRDGYKRLIKPSIVTEVLKDLKTRSDRESIDLFSESLRQVLLYPPVTPAPVLAIDPGFRTGCKVVCLDLAGKLLHHDVIYPVPPLLKVAEAENKIKKLLKKFDIRLIALGDGTASMETEAFLRKIGLDADVRIERVSEQGASIYSASDVARKEFPYLDLTFRSAVSIGRRLLDPLAELVKIDPKSIGVGQYQHDVNQSLLKDALDFTVERCVNEVGVNLNTASTDLLSYISGVGKSLAENIVAYRNANGIFQLRKELLKVPRFGQKAFELASGFIRVPESANPLDNSAVHPECYHVVESMARKLGVNVRDLIGNTELLRQIVIDDYVTDEIGIETLKDIITELHKPGRDPRQAQEADWRNRSITSIADLRTGMMLKGRIVNLTAFGAFVDLGIKTKGLIHISKISRKRISLPSDILKMFQIVDVKVIDVDMDRERISLSMIDL